MDKHTIAISAPIKIIAGDGEGAAKGPAKFQTSFYTGGALNIAGWDLPVVVDLAGLKQGNVLVANLDHDPLGALQRRGAGSARLPSIRRGACR